MLNLVISLQTQKYNNVAKGLSNFIVFKQNSVLIDINILFEYCHHFVILWHAISTLQASIIHIAYAEYLQNIAVQYYEIKCTISTCNIPTETIVN